MQSDAHSNRCVYPNTIITAHPSLPCLFIVLTEIIYLKVKLLGVKASQHESFPQALVKLCCVIATAHREAKQA